MANLDWSQATLAKDDEDLEPVPATEPKGFIPKGRYTPTQQGGSLDWSQASRDKTFDQGFSGTLKSGITQATRAISATGNLYAGDTDRISELADAQKAERKDARLEGFYSDVVKNTGMGTGGEAGLWESVKGVGRAVVDNPAGAALAVTEQIPNAVPTLAGGVAGAKAGSKIGGVAGAKGKAAGAALGYVTGMWFGNTATETGHKALDAVANEGALSEEDATRIKKEGAIKGGVISIVDGLTLGVGGKISSAFRQTASNAVESATRKALTRAGVDVTDAAAVAAARTNPVISSAVMDAQKNAARLTDSLRRRSAEIGIGLTIESIGEGLGEYLGEAAATGQQSVPEAVLEGLLSLGQSGAETAFNVVRARRTPVISDEWRAAPVITPTITDEDDQEIVVQPSVAAGLDPAKGVMNAAAAVAVDSGAATSSAVAPAGSVLNPAAEGGAEATGAGVTAQRDAGQSSVLEGVVTSPSATASGFTTVDTVSGKPVTVRTEDLQSDAPLLRQYTEAGKAKAVPAIRRDSIIAPAEDVLTPQAGATIVQPRDRSRPASVVQMQSMAANPDYMRLGASRSPESGAPMVFAVGDRHDNVKALGRKDVAVMSDGQRVPFQYAVVEAEDAQPSNFADGRVNPLFDSGSTGTVVALNNGRVAGLRAAYDRNTAGGYRQEMESDAPMHGIDPAVIGSMRHPVLVRLYSEKDNRANMGARSQSQALGMSATEQAQADAEMMDAGVIEAFGAGEMDRASNREFVRAFIGRLQANGQDVAGMVDAGGALSPDGARRLQAALVHKAFGDGGLVEQMFGSTDNDIRAIGEALKAVAGEWASMRHAAASRIVNQQVDVTGNLLQAIRMVQKARRENSSLYDAVRQRDLVTGEEVDAITVGVLHLLYSGEHLTRAVGRTRLEQSLRDYVASAMTTRNMPDMLGERVGPAQILAAMTGERVTQRGQDNGAESTDISAEGSKAAEVQRGTTGDSIVGIGADEAGARAQRQEPDGASPEDGRADQSGVVAGGTADTAASSGESEVDLFGVAPSASQQAAAKARADNDADEQRRRDASPPPEMFRLGMEDARTGREVDPGQQEMLDGNDAAAPTVAKNVEPAMDAADVIERHGLPADTQFNQGKGALGSGKWIAISGKRQGNLEETIDKAAQSLAKFIEIDKANISSQERKDSLAREVAAKIKNGDQPSDVDLRDLFGLEPRHTYVDQAAVGWFLVNYMGVSRNGIRKALGLAAGDRTSDGGAKYPIVFPRKLHKVFGPKQNADSPIAAKNAGQSQDGEIQSLRQQLRDVEAKIIQAAPDAMGQGGGDIEAAMKSRNVPVSLKRQRRMLKEQLRALTIEKTSRVGDGGDVLVSRENTSTDVIENQLSVQEVENASSEGGEYANTQESLASRLAQWSSVIRLGDGGPRPVETNAESIGTVTRNESGAAYQGDVDRGEIREQSQRLIRQAKARGFFWEHDSPILAALDALPSDRISGGAEHRVFIVGDGAERFVIRATDNGFFGPRSDISPAQYMARLDDYSQTFPAMQTQVIGVSESGEVEGNAVIWTAQPYVRGSTFDSQTSLADAMRTRGWEQVGGAQSVRFRHPSTGTIIEDANTDNVFQGDNGDLYPFDVVVEALPANDLRLTADTQSSEIKMSKAAKRSAERNLIITHNLSPEKLLHAVKMGGLAAPSLAITTNTEALSEFGSITLVGRKEMANPGGASGTRVFGADIYSPRYPGFERVINKKKYAALEEHTGGMAERLGERLPYSAELSRDGYDVLARSSVMLGQFLKDNDIEPSIVWRPGMDPRRVDRLQKFGLGQFLHETDAFDLLQNSEFRQAGLAELIDMYSDLPDRGRMVERMKSSDEVQDKMLRGLAKEIANAARLAKRPEVDQRETLVAMREQVDSAGLGEQYQQAINDVLEGMTDNERIFNGFTASGNRRYIPHTLENVVKILRKGLRGGEGFNYGAGSLRAHYTPQFRSVDAIRKAKDKLASAEQFEKIKKEIDGELQDVATAIDPNLGLSEATSILAEAAKSGVRGAFRRYGHAVSDAAQGKAQAFLDKLRNLPTAYFEAKITRQVSLAEFAGAVVPDNLNTKTMQALRDAGVTNIQSYKANDEDARKAAMRAFIEKAGDDVLFSLGGQQASKSGSTVNTIATAIRKTYGGNVLDKLQAKGIVTLVQSQDDAIEAAAKARATKTGQPLEQVRAALLASVRNSIAVWHGTPHRGIEKTGFKLNKIGTGEGVQSYGWGAYFASQRGVAEAYQRVLASKHGAFAGEAMLDGKPVENQQSSLANAIRSIIAETQHNQSFDSARALTVGLLKAKALNPTLPQSMLNDVNEAIRVVEALDESRIDAVGGGQLYSLNLPIEESDLLDWDKTLIEQSQKVLEALAQQPWYRYAEESAEDRAGSRGENATGEDIYRWLIEDYTPQEASEMLQAAGIPGLRYLDGNSRSNGKGSHNYVIWDEALMTPESAGIETKFSQNGAIQGFYDPQTGQSFLIADGLTNEAAPGVLAHEIGIHMAADTTSERGRKAMDKLVNRAGMILRSDNSGFMEGVRQRMQDAGETSNEEAAAYIAEEYVRARVNAPASVKRWMQDFIAAARAWLFGKGVVIKADQLTPADIAAVARANVRKAAQAPAFRQDDEGTTRRSVASLADTEVRALVEQYANEDGAPSEGQIREAVRQFRETERAYGGRETWRKASDANRTKLTYGQWVQVRTENFKNWFGDWENDPENASKAVDSQTGEPLVVYHGTRTKGRAIDAFDINRAGSQTDSGWMGQGFYFGSRETADAYAGHYEFDPGHFPEGGAVYPAFLLMRSPATLVDSERNDGPRTMVRELLDLPDSATSVDVRDELESTGHDSVAYQRFSPYGNGYKEYVVLSPSQIKSATGNVGTFGGSNADIRFSRPEASDKRSREDDAAYMAAVERGDMETAQRMVNDAAVRAGYVPDSGHRMSHAAPNSKDDVSLADVRTSGLVPDDYWTHPQWYQSDSRERVAFDRIADLFQRMDRMKIDGKDPENATIAVYRAVPKSVKEGKIRNGDWVSPSESYARDEGMSILGGYRIISQRVKAKNLWWDGNSAAELGYDDGGNYAYKNTKNNRKLLDAVTRDDDGNVIPLSRRFRTREFDPRFSRPDIAGYQSDMFGNPVPSPGRRSSRAAQPATEIRDTQTPEGEYFVRTIVGHETRRKLGVDLIRTPEDAAQATAYLYKSAVERLDGIVTDKDGRPLAVVGGFKGAVAQASVYQSTLVAEAVRVPGAAHIWFSHNHPSGKSDLSNADRSLAATLSDVFNGSGIEPMGLLAVGKGKFSFTSKGRRDEHSAATIPTPGAGITVPVIDREQRANDASITITNPNRAVAVARGFHLQGGDGIMLMNAQNEVAAWVPITRQMRGTLRHTGGLNAIYRAISESNAAAAILVHDGSLDAAHPDSASVTVGNNIAAALAKIDVRPLDSINVKTGESLAQQGFPVSAGPLYSQRGTRQQIPPQLLTNVDAVQSAVRHALDAWKGDKPIVRVVQSVAEARAHGAQLSEDAPADAEGWWDGRSTVWIIAGNNRDVARSLEVLSHEVIGHYGIERIMGGKSWSRLVADVRRLRGLRRSDVSSGTLKALQSAERRYGSEDDATFAREFLAIMAEQGVRSGLTMRVVAAIRRFLARIGVQMNIGKTFREAELLAALHAGRQRVTQARRGQQATSGAPAGAFSRQAANFDQPAGYDFNESDYRPSVVAWAKERFGDQVAANGKPAWQNFTRWFGDSQVVDAEGKPLVVYHGTDSVFTVFSQTGDIGYHFGTEIAARDRAARVGGTEVLVEPVTLSQVEKDSLAALNGEIGGTPAVDLYALLLRKLDWPRQDLRAQVEAMPADDIKQVKAEYLEQPDSIRFAERVDRAKAGEGFRVEVNGETVSTHRTVREANARAARLREQAAKPMALYLRIENPIRLPDLGVWPAQEIAKEAGFSKQEMERVVDADTAEQQYAAVRAILESKGFDGIVYRNEVEHAGEDSYIAFRPEQIKSATDNAGTFDPTNPDIRFSEHAPTFYSAMLESVAVAKGLPKAGGTAQQWKGWMDGAQRRGEFRQAERDWLGVDAWLDAQDKAITREQLADFIRANQVQVEDVVLGRRTADTERRALNAERRELRALMAAGGLVREGDRRISLGQVGMRGRFTLWGARNYTAKRNGEGVLVWKRDGTFGDSTSGRVMSQRLRERLTAAAQEAGILIENVAHNQIVVGVPETERREINARLREIDQALAALPKQPATKFSEYTLPKGRNYREMLLTLPARSSGYVNSAAAEFDAFMAQMQEKYGEDGMWSEMTDAELDQQQRLESERYEGRASLARAERERADARVNYRSSHFDHPNILAHVRFNERTDADGVKTLFLEEIQSDFGQAFRKSKLEIVRQIKADFDGIVKRMKAAGVLEVSCD